jgi:hypothetical protein
MGQDVPVTVMGLKIPWITTQEQYMRFISTVPTKLEQYLLFKTGHNCSHFFVSFVPLNLIAFLLKLEFHKNFVESRVFVL